MDSSKTKRLEQLVAQGVVIDDLSSVYLDENVEIESGARIGPNVQILGNSKIAAGVYIEGSAYLLNTTVEKNARIKFCVRAEDASIGEEAMVGPFAHLRPGTILDSKVKVGNFVETKKAHLQQGAKSSHLTYLGDCKVGPEANIGAGTITCNYNGYEKNKTEIGAKAFIGSNTALVAPVSVGEGATIGAGSVITKNVEKDALAFTRAPQVTKEGWSKRQREKYEK